MQYAISLESGQRIEAASGLVGQCPGCATSLIPKCGPIVVHHWAHRGSADCDPWYEGETLWHRQWKGLFPASWREVVVGPHRADIKRPDGWVIEFQNSPISALDIREREAFYRKIIWIVNAEEFKGRLSLDPFRFCPHCKMESIIKGREEFGGGYVCWRRRGGCGERFESWQMNEVRIIWKRHRPSWEFATAPIFLDIEGEPLFRIHKIRSGEGHGRFVDRHKFINRGISIAHQYADTRTVTSS